MNPKTLFAPVLIVAAFGLSACGGGDDSDTSTVTESAESTTEGSGQGADAPAPSGEAPRAAKVEIADFAYDPDPVTVQAGGKVIWLNQDSAPHTATAEDGSFDTGTLEEGKLKSETFKQAGTTSTSARSTPTCTARWKWLKRIRQANCGKQVAPAPGRALPE